MPGITSFGAYIPLFRLPREAIAKAWGTSAQPGEKAVANHDEDSLTMALEAALDCLNGTRKDGIDALFFASTTAPYREKASSPLIAYAADLPEGVRTADYANTLRAGTSALLAALDAVAAGSAQSVVVTAADCRLGYPRSDQEQLFGDAAAAVVVGKDGVIAEIEGVASHSNEIVDVWRTDSDTFVRTWEDRFVQLYGYQENVQKAVTGLLRRHNLKPTDIAKAVIYAPDARSHAALVRALGFDPKTQVQDPLIGSVGNTGAAHTMLMLVAALQAARPGDRLLVASYGDGADALLLKVTPQITEVKSVRGVKGYLASKKPLPSYERYVAYRGVLPVNPEAPLRTVPLAAATVEWRDRPALLGLKGSRCRKCQMTHFPPQRVCYGCQARDEFDLVRLHGQQATLFTFARDNLAQGLEPPVLQAVVETSEGARVYTTLTDAEPKEAKVGLPVEFTLRRIHEGAGFHNYFWKCRPVRG